MVQGLNDNRQGIKWCDYTFNPIKGLCPIGCWYCYARRDYKRRGWDFKIRLARKILDAPSRLKGKARIFVGSTIEIFNDQVPDAWIHEIIRVTKANPQHIFQFLSKRPARYLNFEFPKNCWLGCTITGQECAEKFRYIKEVKMLHENLIFVSFEPLLGMIYPDTLDHIFNWADWGIIGRLTRATEEYSMAEYFSWAKEIAFAADNYNKPIFTKDNVWRDGVSLDYKGLLARDGRTMILARQQFPKEVTCL